MIGINEHELNLKIRNEQLLVLKERIDPTYRNIFGAHRGPEQTFLLISW